MSHRSHRVRNLALAAVAVVLIAVALAGLYRSTRTDRVPAPLSLAEAVEAYRIEIEESLREREFGQAEQRLRAARELQQAAPPLYHDLLGRALLGQPGRADEAEAQFREALRHDPELESARRSLAYLQARTDDQVTPPGIDEGPTGGEGLELARGRLCARLFQRAELEALHGTFSEELARQLSLEALREMQLTVTRRLGSEIEVLGESVVPGPNFRLYTRTARFEKHDAAIDFVVQLTDAREVSGLEFRLAKR